MTQSAPGPDPDDDPPARPPELRDGTLYVQGAEDDDGESSNGKREVRGGRASTVLTALLVAVGLALPGVAIFLRRPPAQGLPVPEASSGVTALPGAPSMSGETRPAQGSSTEVTAKPGTVSLEQVPSRASSTESASSRGSLKGSKPTSGGASAPPSPLVGALARGEPRPPSSSAHSSERLRADLEDTTLPPEARSLAALALLDAHLNRERWRSLAMDAERISQLDLPRYQLRLPAEQAAWLRIHAARNLEQWDTVLRIGPTFRQAYPDSPLVPAVDAIVRSTLVHRSNAEDNQRVLRADLRAEEDRAARDIARLEGLGRPATEPRRRLDFQRCRLPADKGFHAEALVPCRAFLATWPVATTPAELGEYRDVRGLEIKALVGLRRYAEARERLAAFLASDPEGEPRTRARAVIQSIPVEAEE
ncbi:hypothetical protein D7Y13_00545 [Corallococcus praedator]|uniref:Uncharacterized protein n=1 Tax=Corallococcus praedator TaxID=2316724 RepID=A0ABX9QRT6_9BACT|nr:MULTISPECIES: hypothetical protein [Corallococcus]RKH35920.1 hypothetical protein D7X75_02615 [Corallococcus sp. CA031C]RKI17616.1 hypothetical protein D7Y13_00545 [Corallococcus praedator]